MSRSTFRDKVRAVTRRYLDRETTWGRRVAPAKSEVTPYGEFVVCGEDSAFLSPSPTRACSLTHATLAATGVSITSKKEARHASRSLREEQYPARGWSLALRGFQV